VTLNPKVKVGIPVFAVGFSIQHVKNVKLSLHNSIQARLPG